jgi:hypothetical protein
MRGGVGDAAIHLCSAFVIRESLISMLCPRLLLVFLPQSCGMDCSVRLVLASVQSQSRRCSWRPMSSCFGAGQSFWCWRVVVPERVVAALGKWLFGSRDLALPAAAKIKRRGAPHILWVIQAHCGFPRFRPQSVHYQTKPFFVPKLGEGQFLVVTLLPVSDSLGISKGRPHIVNSRGHGWVSNCGRCVELGLGKWREGCLRPRLS